MFVVDLAGSSGRYGSDSNYAQRGLRASGFGTSRAEVEKLAT